MTTTMTTTTLDTPLDMDRPERRQVCLAAWDKRFPHLFAVAIWTCGERLQAVESMEWSKAHYPATGTDTERESADATICRLRADAKVYRAVLTRAVREILTALDLPKSGARDWTEDVYSYLASHHPYVREAIATWRDQYTALFASKGA